MPVEAGALHGSMRHADGRHGEAVQETHHHSRGHGRQLLGAGTDIANGKTFGPGTTNGTANGTATGGQDNTTWSSSLLYVMGTLVLVFASVAGVSILNARIVKEQPHDFRQTIDYLVPYLGPTSRKRFDHIFCFWG